MAACRAEALSKVYGRRDTEVHALRNITLSIPPHAFTAIMGPSGSGKSTLLHCLAALDTPTSGRVFLGQTELTSLSRRQQAQVRRDRIGFVFQAFNLVPTLDAIENITLPQLLAGRRPDRQWLEYVVAQIGLGDRMHHRPSQLSGGQQQRVALARALAGRPEVIFADEPTGNLDTKASREMLALLRSAVDDFRQTVVTVTHDPAIAGYADLVLFFTDGRVVDQVVHPEPDLVLEHLQYLDSSTTAHVRPRGQLHVSTQSDGQQIMRSRRRRQADETGPGRPMVGSDDEVEVARQERWLQRIREQFEVEHEAAARDRQPDAPPVSDSQPFGHFPTVSSDAAEHVAGAPGDGLTGAAGTNGFGHDPRRDTGNGHAAASYDISNGHHTGNGHHVAAPHDTSNGHHREPHARSSGGAYRNGHGDTHAFDAGDDGWLPVERSWLTDTSGPVDNGQPDTTQRGGADQSWSQPDPVAEPTHHAPPPIAGNGAVGPTSNRGHEHTPAAGSHEHTPAAGSHEHTPAAGSRWHTNDWDLPERTQRWDSGDHAAAGGHEVWASADTYRDPDVWASADRAVADQDANADRSWPWSDETGHQSTDSTDGAWSAHAAPADDGWSSITPQASADEQPPAAEPWDAGGTSQQGRRVGEPRDDSVPPANGHVQGPVQDPVQDAGWQRWEPDPHAGTNGNGHQDVQPDHGPSEHPVEAYRHDEPSMVPDEARATVDSGWQVGEPHVDSGRYEHTAHDGYPPDDTSRWTSHDNEGADDAHGPASLDIWSPSAGAEDPWYRVPPSEAEHGGDVHQPMYAEPAIGNASGPLIHEPRDLPPEVVPQSQPSADTATDPFEALQSLQSQLNRLGASRRPPRRPGG